VNFSISNIIFIGQVTEKYDTIYSIQLDNATAQNGSQPHTIQVMASSFSFSGPVNNDGDHYCPESTF